MAKLTVPFVLKKKGKTRSGAPKGPTREELASPEVLWLIFSPTNLAKALARIAKRGKDNLVTHPLRALILTEFREQITDQLVQSIPPGAWSPSGAYVSLTSKRSGAYRELVFPTVIDGLVGRCLIDALESQINADDDGKTFSGRTHFSNTREFGEYDDWFQVWQDYSAAIDKAAKTEGYIYVFDTDINDFFPSIDRTRAKALIAAKTGAHPSLLELLFYCLEAWLPRFSYSPMTGVPVEANDVSRVVAHAYLKTVDAVFKRRTDCIYLRYVDDTVVFAKTASEAQTLCRLHHLELRQLGLNPNASKTEVLTVEEFQARRHRDMNLRIDAAKRHRKKEELDSVVNDWFALDRRKAPSWDKVARKIYSIARQLKSEVLRERAIDDAKTPMLATVALPYLVSFDLKESEFRSLVDLAQIEHLDMQTAIVVASAILDGRIEPKWSEAVVDAAYAMLRRQDDRHGVGYLKAQWLLVLHKHGVRKDREAIKATFNVNFVDDHMWRLHYLYVAVATGALKIAEAGTASMLANSDLQLAIRLCGAVATARLKHRDLLLSRAVRIVNGKMGIPGQYLPFVRLLLQAEAYRTKNVAWVKGLLARKGSNRIHDEVVGGFLQKQYDRLTA